MKTRCTVFCAIGALLATSAATAAVSLKGTWVATTKSGKTTLRLAGSGSSYHGTMTTVAGGKQAVAKITGRFDNADGAKQLTLTFPATHTTTMCGLVGTKLYCQLATGTAVLKRA